MTPIAGLGLARRDGSELSCWPSAAPLVVTAGAGAWQWGAWRLLSIGVGPRWLSTVHGATTTQPVNLETAVLELATGPGRDPLYATRSTMPIFNLGPGTLFFGNLTNLARAIPVDPTAGVYARLATSAGGSKTAEVFTLTWWGALPTWVALSSFSAAGPARYYPANTGGPGITITSGPNWVMGASATVVDPAPNDMLVTGLISSPVMAALLNNAGLIEVGYGPDGSETWCATVSHGRCITPDSIYPPVLILAGERLAIRFGAVGPVTISPFLKVTDLY